MILAGKGGWTLKSSCMTGSLGSFQERSSSLNFSIKSSSYEGIKQWEGWGFPFSLACCLSFHYPQLATYLNIVNQAAWFVLNQYHMLNSMSWGVVRSGFMCQASQMDSTLRIGLQKVFPWELQSLKRRKKVSVFKYFWECRVQYSLSLLAMYICILTAFRKLTVKPSV